MRVQGFILKQFDFFQFNLKIVMDQKGLKKDWNHAMAASLKENCLKHAVDYNSKNQYKEVYRPAHNSNVSRQSHSNVTVS